MECFISFALIVVAAALGVYIQHRRSQPREIRFDETPAIARDEALLRAPGMVVDRVVQKRSTFRFKGQADGRPIQVKVRLRGAGASRQIDKTEVQFETRSAYRSLKNKRLIDPAEVPRKVLEQAEQVVHANVGALERIVRIKRGQVQSRTAYDIKGVSGNWRVEVELLDDGQLLELEVKKQR